jgi:sulfatase maturation enzyme AslB (radical SAM superfamily)
LLKKMAVFIPKDKRLELFRKLYQVYNCNAQEVAKNTGINLRCVYFYIPNGSKGVRNIPSDKTTYNLLKAYMKKDLQNARLFLKEIYSEFEFLYNSINSA